MPQIFYHSAEIRWMMIEATQRNALLEWFTRNGSFRWSRRRRPRQRA